jgi:alkylhydroperoxidase family enzyme
MLAHGAVLRSRFYSPAEVEAIARDYRSAGLAEVDVAIMALAEKVARHAYQVSPEDIDGLRRHGLSDGEILDVILTAAARCFFSKVLDALGARPDDHYLELEPSLREALTGARPFGEGSESGQ